MSMLRKINATNEAALSHREAEERISPSDLKKAESRTCESFSISRVQTMEQRLGAKRAS